MNATIFALLIALFVGSTGGKAAGLLAKNKGFGRIGNPLIGMFVAIAGSQALIAIGVLANTQNTMLVLFTFFSSFLVVLIASYFKKESITFSESD